MDLKEYQEKAQETSKYPGKGEGNMAYATLGLTAAAGKLAKVAHRRMRGIEGNVPHEVRDLLGNALWYVQELAQEAGIGLGEVAQANLSRLAEKEFVPFD